MKKNEKTISSLENQKQSLSSVKGGQQLRAHDEYLGESAQRGEVLDDIKPVPGKPVSPTALSNKRVSTRGAE